MPLLAREVNLSETAFPTVVGENRYDNRIFTPTRELPFAGHPSLGTAWVLGPNRWTQVTRGASITVDADESGARMTAPDAVLTEIDPSLLVAAFGLPRADGAFVAEAGIRHAIVATDAPIEHVTPDLLAMTAAVETETVAVVRRRDEGSLHVRVFAPGAGVAEDPGTGSAAGPIALVARRLWQMADDVVIHQGLEIGRPCRIEVQVEGDTVWVGGAVVDCARGTFTL